MSDYEFKRPRERLQEKLVECVFSELESKTSKLSHYCGYIEWILNDIQGKAVSDNEDELKRYREAVRKPIEEFSSEVAEQHLLLWNIHKRVADRIGGKIISEYLRADIQGRIHGP